MPFLKHRFRDSAIARNRWIVLFSLTTALAMGYIFFNAAQPSAISNARSRVILERTASFWKKTEEPAATNESPAAPGKNKPLPAEEPEKETSAITFEERTEEKPPATRDAPPASSLHSTKKTQEMDPELRLKIIEYIRKTAHFLEYFLLGLSMGALLFAIRRKYGTLLWATGLFWGLMTAVCDEFIQGLKDRTSSVKDVVLDFAGVFCGMLLLLAILYLIFRKRIKNSKDQPRRGKKQRSLS